MIAPLSYVFFVPMLLFSIVIVDPTSIRVNAFSRSILFLIAIGVCWKKGCFALQRFGLHASGARAKMCRRGSSAAALEEFKPSIFNQAAAARVISGGCRAVRAAVRCDAQLWHIDIGDCPLRRARPFRIPKREATVVASSGHVGSGQGSIRSRRQGVRSILRSTGRRALRSGAVL